MVKKNWLLFSLGTFGIIFILLFLFGIFPIKLPTFAIIPFTSQCSLESCPTGYKDLGSVCDSSTNECRRSCQMELPTGKCGTFGAWQGGYGMTDNIGIGTDTKQFSSSTLVMKAKTCYQFRSVVDTSITDFDPGGFWHAESGSYKIKTSVLRGDGESLTGDSCSNTQLTNNNYAGSIIQNEPIAGINVKAIAKVIPYTSSNCGGSIAYGMTGKVIVGLQYTSANWIPDIDYKNFACTYECDSNSDCGQTGEGIPYCSGNSIIREDTLHTCSNYKCSSSTQKKTVQSCPYKCENSGCIGECSNNAEKCDGTSYSLCENYNWVSKGNVAGKCGYSVPSGGGTPPTIQQCNKECCVNEALYLDKACPEGKDCINNACKSLTPCPLASPPICSANEVLTSKLSSDGCSYSICESKITPPTEKKFDYLVIIIPIVIILAVGMLIYLLVKRRK